MNSGGGSSKANEAALADYFDDLLDTSPEQSQPRAANAPPETDAHRIEVAAGCILADDERHYLFELAGLRLALPATRISAEFQPPLLVQTADAGSERLARLPAGGTCRMIDLAALVLAGNRALMERSLGESPGASLILDGLSWGFQIRAPGELKLLDLDQVQWRGPNSQRPWLAGTARARRLVLLDLDGLAATLV